MLGCPGPSRTWKGVLDFSKGHTLAHTRVTRGEVETTFFFCTTCGAYTERRCFLLGQDCPQRKIAGAPTTLRRIFEGKHPHYSYEGAHLGSVSRHGVDYLQYAATLPPPPEVRPPPRGLSALPQTSGMRALLARLQAREAAARGAASSS